MESIFQLPTHRPVYGRKIAFTDWCKSNNIDSSKFPSEYDIATSIAQRCFLTPHRSQAQKGKEEKINAKVAEFEALTERYRVEVPEVVIGQSPLDMTKESDHAYIRAACRRKMLLTVVKAPIPHLSKSQFVATDFATQEDKLNVASKLIQFINTGFYKSRFKRSIYKAVSSMRGHIAEYDLDGFYVTWFSTPDKQFRFLKRWAEEPIVGSPSHTYSDIEFVVQEWLLSFRFGVAEPKRVTLAGLLQIPTKK